MNDATRALEEIRRAELEAAQHVESARAQARQIEDDAKGQVRQIVEDGRERGRAAARSHLAQMVEEAEKTAAGIRAVSEKESLRLDESAAASLSPLVEEMVQMLLAPPSEPGS